MSWAYNKSGRAGALGAVVKDQITAAGGCPAGSAEETAKNKIGEVAETLCKSLPADAVVSIKANGSAWNNADGTAKTQHCQFSLETLGDFVD